MRSKVIQVECPDTVAGEFREDNFARAMASLTDNAGQAQENKKKGRRGGTKGALVLTPEIHWSFSLCGGKAWFALSC
jgi:hypothetical protein